jgi:hypothetical protein
LVLAWPEQERANATLFLDGQSVDVPPLGPVELRCQAGDRVIEAVRPGFERYRKSLHVDEGQKVGVDLSWTRAPAPKIAQAKSSDVREQNQIVELPKAQTPAPIQQSAIDAAREPQQKETAPNSPAETAVSYGLVAFQWPEQERSNAALFFDGQQFALSTSGPLEFQRPLGTCLVEATRPGYERFARQITVMSGRTVNVEFAWKPVARNSIDFSGLWRSSTGKQYELVDDGSVIHVKLVDASGDYLSGRLIRHGRDELRSTVWEATFANDRLRRRWNLRTELTVVSSKELRGRYETVFWGASPGTVVRRFPNHCTWKKVE